jgi:hypothetical protein
VKRRMNFSSAFKQRRKTSAYNATVALVMQELNEGKCFPDPRPDTEYSPL